MIFNIAFKNLIAAGVRTWINVFLLLLTLLTIVFMDSLYNGMQDEMTIARGKDEVAGGKLWHPQYDPFDPLTLEDARGVIPPLAEKAIFAKNATPLLILSGAAYVRGRFQSMMFYGVQAEQRILEIPFDALNKPVGSGLIPILLGVRTANKLGVAIGEQITLRWRTQAGAFNAIDVEIAGTFKTQVPLMDQGKIYLHFSDLNKLNGTTNMATLIWSKKGEQLAEERAIEKGGDWAFQTPRALMADMYQLIETKKAGGMIFYALLMSLAMINLFDTQALAVFRRKKEIGTLMALGMSKRRIVGLFVTEGMMHSLIAMVLLAVVGIPLFYWLGNVGISFGVDGDAYGLALGAKLYPIVTVASVFKILIMVNLFLVFVCYWPVRKITKLEPSEALRGR